MNSAKRAMTKRVRKIHKDQKPRRLCRKFESLRWVRGEIMMPRNLSDMV
jgi:hypothetical protein